MEHRKKILHWVLIYIVIIVTFLLFDLLFLDGAFRRDLIANFVHEGMEQMEALRILGAPTQFRGKTYEFSLPFGNQMVLQIIRDGNVISINSDSYPFQGILIPVIAAAVAVVETVWYILCRRKSKQNQGKCRRLKRKVGKEQSKKAKVLRLLLIYAFIIEVFIVCDLFFLDGVFCRDFMANFLYKGMDVSLAYALVGKPRRNVGSGAYIMVYSLPFGNQLELPLWKVVYNIGQDDYPFRGAYLPMFMGAVAGLEAAWYLLRARRAKKKAISCTGDEQIL